MFCLFRYSETVPPRLAPEWKPERRATVWFIRFLGGRASLVEFRALISLPLSSTLELYRFPDCPLMNTRTGERSLARALAGEEAVRQHGSIAGSASGGQTK